MGVPQRSARSGLCWWGSLLFCAARPPAVRAFVREASARSASPAARAFAALFVRALSDPRCAQALHDALHRAHGLGDRPGAEEREGQNGYVQLAMLARVCGWPMLTALAPRMGAGPA